MDKAKCIASGNCQLLEVGQVYLIRPVDSKGRYVYVNYPHIKSENAHFAILKQELFESLEEEISQDEPTSIMCEQLSLF